LIEQKQTEQVWTVIVTRHHTYQWTVLRHSANINGVSSYK